jgi:hypothetical protein
LNLSPRRHDNRTNDVGAMEFRSERPQTDAPRAVRKQENSMSKLVKIAVILAVAAVAIAARQLSPSVDMSAEAQLLAPASSVSPAEFMHRAGPLPETQVDSYF